MRKRQITKGFHKSEPQTRPYVSADAAAALMVVGRGTRYRGMLERGGCHSQQPNIFGFNGDKSQGFGTSKHGMLKVRIPYEARIPLHGLYLQ